MREEMEKYQFYGKYIHKIDSKGRLSINVELREVLRNREKMVGPEKEGREKKKEEVEKVVEKGSGKEAEEEMPRKVVLTQGL